MNRESVAAYDKGRFHQTLIVCQAKREGTQRLAKKNCHSISPTKLKPNMCAENCQTLFAVYPICALKKASHPVHTKKAALVC